MARVKVKVAGGYEQDKEAATVGELSALVGAQGYQAAVNGENADEATQLRNNDFVSFAKPTKAA